MSLALLFHYLLAQHVSNVSTSIFRSLRIIVDLSHVVRLGWCGILMQAEALLQPA
jgi:hypothetical protein